MNDDIQATLLESLAKYLGVDVEDLELEKCSSTDDSEVEEDYETPLDDEMSVVDKYESVLSRVLSSILDRKIIVESGDELVRIGQSISILKELRD